MLNTQIKTLALYALLPGIIITSMLKFMNRVDMYQLEIVRKKTFGNNNNQFYHRRPKPVAQKSNSNNLAIEDSNLETEIALGKAENLESPSQNFGEEEEPIQPKKPYQVILLTEYRSGSTFTAELFNKNPSAFYYFEPLWPISPSTDKNLDTNKKLLETFNNYINDLLSCEIKDMKEIFPHGPGRDGRPGGHLAANCVDENFCWRSRHDRLRKEPFCPVDSNSKTEIPTFPERAALKKCGKIDLNLAKKTCKDESDLVVTKLIRYQQIKHAITYYSNQQQLDIINTPKIIYVIRDPRAIAASRIALREGGWNEHNSDKLSKICDEFHKNALFLRLNIEQINSYQFSSNNNFQSTFIKSRILVIRYEDLNQDQLQGFHQIYDFLDIPSSNLGYQQVEKWVQSNIAKDRRKRDGISTAFGTKRDKKASLLSLSKWARKLKYSTVKLIQDNCGLVFKEFGYQSLTELEMLQLGNQLMSVDSEETNQIQSFSDDCPLCQDLAKLGKL